MFADKLLQNGLPPGHALRHLDRHRRHARAEGKAGLIERAEKEVKEIEQQYVSGLVTAGERYNKVVDIWGKTGDEVGKVMMSQLVEAEDRRPPRQGRWTRSRSTRST